MTTTAVAPGTASRVPSLGWMIAWNAARRPGAPAIREPDGPPIDHRALAGRVGALAARLRDVGVVPGEVVAILVSGVADHLVATLAVSTVAAIALPLDPAWPDVALTDVTASTGARRVLADHGNGGRLPLERVAIGVSVAGARLVVADGDFDAVQRLVPRPGAPDPIAVTNRAALWAQHAAIRELDLHEGDAVRVRSVAALIAEADLSVLATLAAGGTIVCGTNGPTACRELPAVVACDTVVGPLATIAADGGGLRIAGDLDGRIGPVGTLEIRGPRSVGGSADDWVDSGAAVVARPNDGLGLAATA